MHATQLNAFAIVCEQTYANKGLDLFMMVGPDGNNYTCLRKYIWAIHKPEWFFWLCKPEDALKGDPN